MGYTTAGYGSMGSQTCVLFPPSSRGSGTVNRPPLRPIALEPRYRLEVRD